MQCGNCQKKAHALDNFCKHCGQLVHVHTRYVQRWTEDSGGQHQVAPLSLQHIKAEILSKFEQKKLDDVFAGRQVQTDMGSCYLIESTKQAALGPMNRGKARQSLLSDLKLLYGIGPVTEQKLKSQGYTSIEKLADHPRYKGEARHFLYCIKNADQKKLLEWICRWFNKSHPHIFCLSSFNHPSDFLILDIETLGLLNRPIILMGMAAISQNQLMVKQYLARNYDEEASLLMCLQQNIGPRSVFISFNGSGFDLPFIRQRSHYYRLQPDLARMHFDMLHFSRNMLKERFARFNLAFLEKNFLRVKRKQDLPSCLVPDLYEHYIQQKASGVLIPIIYHNRQDLISLAQVFFKLYAQWEKF